MFSEKYSASNPAYNVRPGLKFAFSHPAHTLALFFGAGCLRPGPGTWGTLAGVLACSADVIVLDEATSMIDPRGRDELVRAVTRAREERGATVIWITHDMELAARADRVVVMRDGEVAADGAPEDVLANETLLEGAGLEPPLVVRAWRELEGAGVVVGPAPVTVEGLVSALCE